MMMMMINGGKMYGENVGEENMLVIRRVLKKKAISDLIIS